MTFAEHLFTHGITDIRPFQRGTDMVTKSMRIAKLLCWGNPASFEDRRNIGDERRQNATVKFSQCTLILGQNNKLYPPKRHFSE